MISTQNRKIIYCLYALQGAMFGIFPSLLVGMFIIGPLTSFVIAVILATGTIICKKLRQYVFRVELRGWEDAGQQHWNRNKQLRCRPIKYVTYLVIAIPLLIVMLNTVLSGPFHLSDKILLKGAMGSLGGAIFGILICAQCLKELGHEGKAI